MIRIFSIVFLVTGISIACNNKKSGDKKAQPGPDSSAIINDQKKKEAEANDKIAEDLQKLTPLTEEQLKKLVPESLMGATLSNYSYSSTLGASLTSGEYKINDSTGLTINIYDCAGAGGAGLYNLQFAGQLDYSTDNENEYTKVISFGAGKAIEHCMKFSNECSLTYFSGGRFLVGLEGNNVGADGLKKVAHDLKIK